MSSAISIALSRLAQDGFKLPTTKKKPFERHAVLCRLVDATQLVSCWLPSLCVCVRATAACKECDAQRRIRNTEHRNTRHVSQNATWRKQNNHKFDANAPQNARAPTNGGALVWPCDLLNAFIRAMYPHQDARIVDTST